MRYSKLVEAMDQRGASVQQITEALDLDPTDWAGVLAAGRVYLEEGGQRYSWQDFIASVEAKIPPEVLQQGLDLPNWVA